MANSKVKSNAMNNTRKHREMSRESIGRANRKVRSSRMKPVRRENRSKENVNEDFGFWRHDQRWNFLCG